MALGREREDGSFRYRINSPTPLSRVIECVRQETTRDCGAACLVMMLGYHARTVDLASITAELNPRADVGSSAYELLRVAARHGLTGRGLRIAAPSIDLVRPPAILHWRRTHFVVLDACTAEGIQLVDPLHGRVTVTREEFEADFSGVAIVMWPQ